MHNILICQDLIRQMDVFTGRGKEEDDIVDAASMLFATIDEFYDKYWVVQSNYKRHTHTLMDIFNKPKLKKLRDNFAA